MDWDDDGRKDIVAGDTEGNVWLFRNTGTQKEPKLAKGKRVKADGKAITAQRRTYKRQNGRYVVDKVIPGSSELAEIYSKLHVADWDGDGLKDILVGHNNTIITYKNVGSSSEPRFQSPVKIETPEGKFPVRPSPYVVDWDDDGKNDLLVGTEQSQVYFHRNIGTENEPELSRGKLLNLKMPKANAGYRWRIDVADWNNDGKKDLLVGNFYSKDRTPGGNIWLFLGK